MKNLTILIDSGYFIYSAVFANFHLTYKDFETKIYYGLLNSARTMIKKFKPSNVIFMWDSSYSYRMELFPQYKEKRFKESNPKLIEKKNYIIRNLPDVKSLIKNIGFVSYNRFGLEADDLFALYVNQFPEKNIIIATCDSDIYQLLYKDRVKIYDPKLKILKTEKWFTKKYEITPFDWKAYKAINGCTSDSVPGIPKIGEKYTLDFIKGKASPKIAEKITNNWNIVSRNLPLVSLPFKELTIPLKYKQSKINKDIFFIICQKYGFRSFMKNLNEWKLYV